MILQVHVVDKNMCYTCANITCMCTGIAVINPYSFIDSNFFYFKCQVKCIAVVMITQEITLAVILVIN